MIMLFQHVKGYLHVCWFFHRNVRDDCTHVLVMYCQHAHMLEIHMFRDKRDDLSVLTQILNRHVRTNMKACHQVSSCCKKIYQGMTCRFSHKYSTDMQEPT